MASLLRPLGRAARPLLLLLLPGFLALPVRAQSHFSCLDGTGNIYNATVIVTADEAPEIDGQLLSPGSEIAVFSRDSAYPDLCVGKMTWEETTGSITVWGDDALTEVRDGLDSGDVLSYRLWDADSDEEVSVDSTNVAYLLGSGTYTDDAAFVLSSLTVSTPGSNISVTNDIVSTDEETPIVVDALANDEASASPLDPSSVSIVLEPSHGEIQEIDPDTGKITYVPDVDYAGSDKFKYIVHDMDDTDSRIGTVRLTVQNVNDPPSALADEAETAEDTEVDIDVLGNDSDIDGAELDYASVQIHTVPEHGVVLDINPATGVVTYLPETDYAGSDGFTYSVLDLSGATSDTVLVEISITNVNDAPFAAADASETDEDTAVDIDVLANDSDVDGNEIDAASVRIRLFPANGSIVGVDQGTGKVTYKPDKDYFGPDSFSYTVSDESGALSDEVVVDISVAPVNDDPTFVGHPIVNTAVNYLYAYHIRTRDVENDALTIKAPVLPGWLKLKDNGDGTADLTGTPDGSNSGDSNVELKVEDGNGGSTTHTFTVSVSDNAAPIAQEDVVSSDEDSFVLVDVLGNDSDPEGDAFDIASITIVTPPVNGNVGYIYPETGEVTYEPNENFNGYDEFEYQVSDVRGHASNVVSVLITVVPVNDAPTAVGETAQAIEDGSVSIDVLANDSDLDGDEIHVAEILEVTNGTASIEEASGRVSYTPNPDFSGPDTFTYRIEDTGGLSAEATATVLVAPTNDAPSFAGEPATLASPGTLYEYAVETSDPDAGDVLLVTLITGPSWLTLGPDGDGSFTLSGTPTSEHLGEAGVTLELTDGTVSVRLEFMLTVSDSTEPLTTRTVLRTPAWGAINIPIDTEFSWEKIEGATRYQLQVTDRNDVDFQSTVLDLEGIDGTAGENEFVLYTATGLPKSSRLIWRVRARNASGFSPWSEVSQYTTSNTATPTEEEDQLPSTVALFQNYPNPFNPSTTIPFELPASGDVTVTIYDLMGREVATLVSEYLTAGRHEIRWDASRLASGMYVYRLRAGTFVQAKTLSLVK